MNSITFLLVLHNHQPVGNFDDVVEATYQTAYRPFLEVLERHPGIGVGLHVSGCLFDWLEANRPEYLEKIEKLVERGQIELIAGGYYEPIFSTISDEDRAAQIDKHRRYLAKRFGRTPTGFWLTERVWEPDFASALARSGIDYTMLDDRHFQAAGLRGDQLWRSWITEDRGRPLRVFPISKELRYLIPFRPPEEAIAFLRRRAAEEPGRVALLGDDGEKFGAWPDTHRAVYDDGWLDRFFDLLEQNQDWIHLRFPVDALGTEPAGKIYLPTAAYSEMMEWSLPAEEQLRLHGLLDDLEPKGPETTKFVHGGFWRNFLARYPESDHLHKRMLALRKRVDGLSRRKTAVRSRITDRLLSAQCNCAYWHGVFGGLYLPHLRNAIYERLLDAEAQLDREEHRNGHWAAAERTDYDCDGSDEIFITNPDVTVVAAPRDGGGLREISIKPLRVALGNGLTRRREAYHDRVAGAVVVAAETDESGGGHESIHDRVMAKEAGLERRLHYDRYRRQSLLDHWFRPDATLDEFDRAVHGEQGDFISEPYEVSIARTADRVTVLLRRTGTVWSAGEPHSVAVEKRIRVGTAGARIEVAHTLENLGESPLAARFGVEWNFGLLAGDSPDHYYRIDGLDTARSRLGSRGELPDVDSVACVDRHRGFELRLDFDRPAQLWRLPVDTVSLSESGFERIYQSSCLVPQWSVSLEPGSPFQMTSILEVVAL